MQSMFVAEVLMIKRKGENTTNPTCLELMEPKTLPCSVKTAADFLQEKSLFLWYLTSLTHTPSVLKKKKKKKKKHLEAAALS